MRLLLLLVPLALWSATVEDRETIQRTFPGANKVLVDNIDGPIRVTAAAGSEVRLRAEKIITAESPEALAEAKRDVKLDISEQGRFARFYVDGPFRQHDRGRQFYGYQVKFEYDIQVPPGTELILKTVNGGDVIVKGTTGPFTLGNVNGGIVMERVGGFGKAHTVNGPLKIDFAVNPTQASDFKTVNGAIEVHFQPRLSAEFQFKTLNGHVYTDFEVSDLGVPPGMPENKAGKFVYRGSRYTHGKVGSGGPEIGFETINGDVRLQTK